MPALRACLAEHAGLKADGGARLRHIVAGQEIGRPSWLILAETTLHFTIRLKPALKGRLEIGSGTMMAMVAIAHRRAPSSRLHIVDARRGALGASPGHLAGTTVDCRSRISAVSGELLPGYRIKLVSASSNWMEITEMTKHNPLMPDDPSVGIKFASTLLGRHKVTVHNQLSPNRPEYDPELAACAYRETPASPWKFVRSVLLAYRERIIERSREREQKRVDADIAA
jgi:hypothetical protein